MFTLRLHILFDKCNKEVRHRSTCPALTNQSKLSVVTVYFLTCSQQLDKAHC